MREISEAVERIVPGSVIKLGSGLWPSKDVPIPRGAISWPTNRPFDISRAKSELGYNPVYDLTKGINDYAAWLRRNWDLYSPERIPFPA